MRIVHTATLIGLLLATHIPVAVAYTGPEETLLDYNPLLGDRQYNSRYLQEVRAQQEEENVMRHTSAPPAPEEEATTTTISEEASSASTTANEQGGPSSNGEKTITIDARTARLLERLDKRPESEVLTANHAGAPLSPTGVGDVAAGVLLAIAVVLTLHWAGKLSKEK